MVDIIELASRIYTITTYDIVKHKLVQSGLCSENSSFSLHTCKQNTLQSKWLKQLEAEQHSDGSWGRFHTQDSKAKQKCVTTEAAAWRLSLLGIGRGSQIIDNMCVYMEKLLNNLPLWPDAWEGNRWFKPAVPLFIASKLSMFESEDIEYKKITAQWVSILNSGFIDNSYSYDNLNHKAIELLGTDIHRSYIGLNGINNLLLFSNMTETVSIDIQIAYLKWLHQLNEPVIYTNVVLANQPEKLTSTSQIQGYLQVMHLLSKFNGFAHEYSREIDWLIKQQGKDGFWDFGSKLNFCQISDHWRNDMNRKIDQTIYVLGILRNCNIIK